VSLRVVNDCPGKDCKKFGADSVPESGMYQEERSGEKELSRLMIILLRKGVPADRHVLEKAEGRGAGKKREKKKEIRKEVLMEKLMVRERASISGRVVTLIVVAGVVVIDFVALDDDTLQSPEGGFPTSRRSTQRLGNSRLVDVETRLRRVALVSPLCLPPRPDLMTRNRTKRLERASLNTRPS